MKTMRLKIVGGYLDVEVDEPAPSFWMDWQWWNTGWEILPIPQ